MFGSDGKIVVLVTTSDAEDASRIARALVDEKLCACVNVVGPIRSVFKWEGKVCDEAEALLVIKTRGALFDRLCGRIRELHSYDVPEVIALPIVAGNDAYLRWIDEETGAG